LEESDSEASYGEDEPPPHDIDQFIKALPYSIRLDIPFLNTLNDTSNQNLFVCPCSSSMKTWRENMGLCGESMKQCCALKSDRNGHALAQHLQEMGNTTITMTAMRYYHLGLQKYLDKLYEKKKPTAPYVHILQKPQLCKLVQYPGERGVLQEPRHHPSDHADQWVGQYPHCTTRKLPVSQSSIKSLHKSYDLDFAQFERHHAILCKPFDEKWIIPIDMNQYVHLKNQYDQLLNEVKDRLSVVIEKATGTHYELVFYGSTATGLFLGDDSDVDISIQPAELEHRVVHKSRVLPMISNYMRRKTDFCKDVNFIRGKVAVDVIKGKFINMNFSVSKNNDQTAFDLSLDNKSGLDSTRLLKKYMEIDTRVRLIMLITKCWAKSRSFIGPNTLPSYAWNLMSVFYLQNVKFLPTIFYEGKTDTFKLSTNWTQPETFQRTPLSVLLWGFFHFYVIKFNWKDHVVSTRAGNTPVAKAQLQNKEKCCLHSNMLYIEDPLHVVHTNKNPNLAHRITGEQWKNIIKVMENMERRMHEALTISGPQKDDFFGSQRISQMFKFRDSELGNRYSEETDDAGKNKSSVTTVGEVAQPASFSGAHKRIQTRPQPMQLSQFGLQTNTAGAAADGESYRNEGVSALSRTAPATNSTNQSSTQPSPISAKQSQSGPRSDDAGVTAVGESYRNDRSSLLSRTARATNLTSQTRPKHYATSISDPVTSWVPGVTMLVSLLLESQFTMKGYQHCQILHGQPT
jgi:DNA polymerase sigma